MRYILILLAIVVTSACTNNWYIGEWTVTDAKFPGISAIGIDEASEWFGSKAVYEKSSVSFQDETCLQPQFSVKDITEAEFRDLYKASFLALEINKASVEMLEVECPKSWTHPGTTLIKVNANIAYMPWDGTFFKLVKNHH